MKGGAQHSPAHRSQAQGQPALTLLTRPECGLCEDMLTELRALAARTPLPPLTIRDVDSEPDWQRRYGLKIPVLLLDSTLVCCHRLDAAELMRLLTRA